MSAVRPAKDSHPPRQDAEAGLSVGFPADRGEDLAVPGASGCSSEASGAAFLLDSPGVGAANFPAATPNPAPGIILSRRAEDLLMGWLDMGLEIMFNRELRRLAEELREANK